MRKVHILEDFDGYPQASAAARGEKRRFVKGEEPELAETYADLIVGKGHAREIGGEARPPEQRSGTDRVAIGGKDAPARPARKGKA